MSPPSLITRCPQCGTESLLWPSPKNFHCSECGFVLYLNIAAAVAVIVECQGKLLFGVRKNEPQRGMLDLPGGFADQGETAEDALRRELKEETGIVADELRYLFSFPNKYLYKGIEYDTLDLIFLVKFNVFPEMKAADDLEELLWIENNKIPLDMIGFNSLRQAVLRYLKEAGRNLPVGE